MKNTPSIGGASSAAPTSPRADHRRDRRRPARRRRAAARRSPARVQRGELRRLVEHRVAGQQRRRRRRWRRRSTDSSRPRRWRPRRAAPRRCARSGRRRVVEHHLVGQHLGRVREEELDAARAWRRSRRAPGDRLAHLAASAARASASTSATSRSRKRANAASRSPSGVAAHAGCAARARATLSAMLAAVSVGSSAIATPVAGSVTRSMFAQYYGCLLRTSGRRAPGSPARVERNTGTQPPPGQYARAMGTHWVPRASVGTTAALRSAFSGKRNRERGKACATERRPASFAVTSQWALVSS